MSQLNSRMNWKGRTKLLKMFERGASWETSSPRRARREEKDTSTGLRRDRRQKGACFILELMVQITVFFVKQLSETC